MSEELPEPEVQYAPSDVIAVLDHLIEVVGAARTLPMSASILVNRAEVLELLNSAKEALPADLIAADGIVADATAVLDRADLEAEQILADANKQATGVRESADSDAQTTRTQADEYATSVREQADTQAQQKLQSAQHQAEQIVAQAQAEAERLVSSENVVREAQERATQTVAAADARARQLAAGADSYCDERLNELEKLIASISKQTRGGRAALASRGGFQPQA